MKAWIKSWIKGHRRIYLLISLLRLLNRSSIRRIDGSKKNYPRVIQLPITYRCNSKCVMCNVWKMYPSGEATPEEFAQFMKDEIFREVAGVGVNGGEPSLVSNLPDYIDAILTLPKLKHLNIITNGFASKRVLDLCEEIYGKCKKKGVHFSLYVSLDGVGEVHDRVRGIPGAFWKAMAVVEEIIKNSGKYCDSFKVGFTITRQNIYNLMEFDAFAQKMCIPVEYRLAVPIRRLDNQMNEENYSIFHDKRMKHLAREFFHYKYKTETNLMEKFKYFGIYYYLTAKEPERILGCEWKEDGITLDPDGSIYYCAVASKKLGSLREKKGREIFFNEDNIQYRKDLIKTTCKNCIHDYNGRPELRHFLIFLKDLLHERFSMKIYEWKARFL